MPTGFTTNILGRWIHAKGSGKRGFASKADVEEAYLRDAGYFKNRAGRYQKVAGGQFATKTEVESALAAATENLDFERNERVNNLVWNQIKNDPDDNRGFMNWVKASWTGRNRGKDKTQAILEATGASNLTQARQMYKQSKAGLLYESIKNIDGATLIREFSNFLDRDMTAYINELRQMTREERYDEAKKQQEAYKAMYGMI